jgi:hypothetical protein
MTAPVRWAGEPEQCSCIRIVVATIEETLACPYGWRLVPGTGWVHSWPPRRQPRVRQTAQAAS